MYTMVTMVGSVVVQRVCGGGHGVDESVVNVVAVAVGLVQGAGIHIVEVLAWRQNTARINYERNRHVN